MTQPTSKSGGWLAGLRNKASAAIEKQQAAFALGRVAGTTVMDSQGKTVVEAGQRIDEAVLERAYQTETVAAVSASALEGQKQDLKEKVQTHYARTESGRESMLLDSVEEYAELHRYLGRVTTMDVTDIRGNVIVPAGKKLEASDAQLAREAGQLGALLAVARESVPAPPELSAAETYVPSASPRRPRTLLGEPEDEAE